jgi:ammonium transporter Rh
MEDILNASLAGGVAVGASAGVLYMPAVALAIGLIAGTISTLGFHYLTPLLERKINLYDTCGIHNLHGIPGVLGGIFSAIVIGAYNNGYDKAYTDNYSTQSIWFNPDVTDHFIRQGGLQVVGTITSLAFGLLAGILTGFILNLTYN